MRLIDGTAVDSSVRHNSILERISNLGILRFSTIQVRLTLFFTLILFASIATVGVVNYRQSSAALNGKIELYSRQVIGQIGANLDLELQHIQFVMEDIISGEDVQSGLAGLKTSGGQQYTLTNAINKTISHKLSMLTYISSVTIRVNRQTTLGTYNSLDKEQLDSIIQRTEGGTDYRYFLIDDKVKGKAFLSISKPIRSAVNGESLGVIVITLEENHIARLYEGTDLGQSAEIFILDDQGSVISSRNKARYPVNRPLRDRELAQRVAGGSSPDGEAYFGEASG
ncbi:cache domain-containing protein, partial [Paenibacillus sepulcri]|nr:cache domain-containing protein [Paenibacillus sepulcri]